VLDRVVHVGQAAGIRGPAVHVHRALPAVQMHQIPDAGAVRGGEAQDHLAVRGVTLRAGREADIGHALPVRGEVGEPVHALVVGELLDAGAVGAHPEQLGVAGGGAAALGVEVDPATVRGVLGAVVGV